MGRNWRVGIKSALIVDGWHTENYDAYNIILILRYEAIKRRINQILDWPLSHPETYERLGIKPPAGLLLHGPSGKIL